MARILGIGGICVDRLAVIPRMPEWDEVEHITRSAVQQGGMVATAMVAAARLGEDVEFLGGVGNDDSGHYLLEVLRQEKIHIERVCVFEHETTSFSLVLVHETSGKRTIIHERGVQANTRLPLTEYELQTSGSCTLTAIGLTAHLTSPSRPKHAASPSPSIPVQSCCGLLKQSESFRLLII